MKRISGKKPPEKHSLERKIAIAQQVIEEGKKSVRTDTRISTSNIHKVQQARRDEFSGLRGADV
jgi:predicted nucleic acid-binding protein